MSEELCFLTIREAARLIEGQEISPVELTEAFLRRIERLDPALNAFIRLLPDEALDAARTAEREIAAGRRRGALHGIPIGLKDIYETRGIATTAHSKLLLDNVPDEDATAVDRLKQAGAVLLGKLATHEFAIGGPSRDLPFPLPRNPWHREAFTGGSSSGSGVGVAAGLMMGALGSDTAGSIRTPASFCGVTGLKPTYGRVSRAGVIPLSYSFDHCGPMAWTAEDVALILEVIAGRDPRDETSADIPVPRYGDALSEDLAGLRIGVVRNFHGGEHAATPEVLRSIEAAADVFVMLGAEIRDVTLSSLDDYHACGVLILLAEGFAVHQHDLCTRPEDYGEISRLRLGMGAFIGAPDYVQATRLRRALCDEMAKAFDTVDVLLTATTFGPAPPVDDIPKHAIFSAPYLTTPFNVTGSPAIAVRCGFTADGLPLSMQLAGRSFDEASVLCAAHAYERATGWVSQRPIPAAA